MGNSSIERVSCTKYLGVLLDEHLTFDEHINYIHKKASNKLGILYRAKDYLDRPTKILLYKSLILPHLDYCDTVYMHTTVAIDPKCSMQDYPGSRQLNAQRTGVTNTKTKKVSASGCRVS